MNIKFKLLCVSSLLVFTYSSCSILKRNKSSIRLDAKKIEVTKKDSVATVLGDSLSIKNYVSTNTTTTDSTFENYFLVEEETKFVNDSVKIVKRKVTATLKGRKQSIDIAEIISNGFDFTSNHSEIKVSEDSSVDSTGVTTIKNKDVSRKRPAGIVFVALFGLLVLIVGYIYKHKKKISL